MTQPKAPGSRPVGPRPPSPPGGTNTGIKNTATNPQLVTSTGGLTGSTGLLLTPYINTLNGNSYVVVHDSNNFDCEENAEYDFRQEIPGNPPQEGRNVSCHLIILKYRELGIASFNVNITVYQQLTDTFLTRPIPVSIKNKNKNRVFPDKRIHTIKIGLAPVITGERPQVTITRLANSGPMSVTSLILCLNADEQPQF